MAKKKAKTNKKSTSSTQVKAKAAKAQGAKSKAAAKGPAQATPAKRKPAAAKATASKLPAATSSELMANVGHALRSIHSEMAKQGKLAPPAAGPRRMASPLGAAPASTTSIPSTPAGATPPPAPGEQYRFELRYGLTEDQATAFIATCEQDPKYRGSEQTYHPQTDLYDVIATFVV